MNITVQHTISMGHRLPSYKGICSSPHGHNARVVATVDAKEDSFLDFKRLSDRLWTVLEPMDHAMILHTEDRLVEALHDAQKHGELFRLVLLNVEPTTEALATYIFSELRQHGYLILSVVVHETEKYSATCTEFSNRVRRVG